MENDNNHNEHACMHAFKRLRHRYIEEKKISFRPVWGYFYLNRGCWLTVDMYEVEEDRLILFLFFYGLIFDVRKCMVIFSLAFHWISNVLYEGRSLEFFLNFTKCVWCFFIFLTNRVSYAHVWQAFFKPPDTKKARI